MSMPCSLCGTYHETTVCPQLPVVVPETSAIPTPAVQVGKVTLNGITFGEQQIIDRLDHIIRLLGQRL